MYNFESKDKEIIFNWNNIQKQDIQIQIISAENEYDESFELFGKLIEENISCIKVVKQKDEDAPLPIIKLSDNIFYHAIPLDKQLEPFLNSLSLINNTATSFDIKNKIDFSETTKSNLLKIDIPVNLKLYIAQQCPHCPKMINFIVPLAVNCKNINLKIIDGTIFTEQAQKDKVMSSPCLILDNDFRWTGDVTTDEITNMIINRDPSSLSVLSLKNILEDGKASWITQQMLEQNKIFKNFISLMLDEIWSVRLGAMVIIEDLVENSSELALKLVPKLLENFENSPESVQGDILYALGEIGNQKTKNQIIDLVKNFDNPELKEAAQEAIEAIELK